MDGKEVLVLKGNNTTLSTGCKRWPREKPRKLFIWWYILWWLKILFFYVKYLMTKYWWVTSYEFVERIIYLKSLFPHSNVSDFHLLCYLTPPPPSPFFPLQIHYRNYWSRDSWKTTIMNYFVELRSLLWFLWH